ncbi:hypothetical protein HYT05_01110 [Candidatus Kaiserbacteria bacterium]|nr:hypothetical protein [Candidatus Kaiserbacteria bacterium]
MKEQKMTVEARSVTVPSSLVSFKRLGNDRIAQDISPGFYPELRKLLLEAGYAGEFQIFVQTKVKGNSHTKGLHFTQANQYSVTLTWHEGDNSNCIQMSLSQLKVATDGYALFTALKAAEKKIAETEEVEDEAQEMQIDNVVALRPSMETVAEKAPESESPPTESTAPAGYERFKENREAATELFMEEAAKVVDMTGFLPKGAGFTILQAMGYRAPGPAMHSMVVHGDLVRTGDAWPNVRHRMSGAWMKRFPPLSANGSTKTTPEAVPAPAVAIPPVQVSSSLVEELRSLRAAAKKISAAREDLVRVEEALARNAAERKVLEERHQAAQAQIASFEEVQATLNDLRSFFSESE